MPYCRYCNTFIEKPTKEQKVGPKMVFCNRECEVADCLTRFPGTSLAAMAERMYPEIVERLKAKGVIGLKNC